MHQGRGEGERRGEEGSLIIIPPQFKPPRTQSKNCSPLDAGVTVPRTCWG